MVYIDYKMPAGVDWRNHMLDKLRTSEIFVVFASRDTAKSDYQNAEIGSARFCSTFVDQKLIVSVVIDQVPIPRTMQDLDCLLQTERDIERTAQAILDAIERRTRRIRLFVSHSHKDEDLASRLVDVITSGLEVPPGAIRCTSVPGYQLDLGTMAPEALRRELGSAACVIAILTPNSVVAEWVLFELGAAWANAKVAIPLLVGGIADSDIPGPFRGAAGGELKNPITLRHLINQLEHNLSWRQTNGLQADAKLYALAQYAAEKENEFTDDETRASLGAKLARIGIEQLMIINYITYKWENRPYISQRELEDKFSSMPTHIFFRLEQLRLLGFFHRTNNMMRSPDARGQKYSTTMEYFDNTGMRVAELTWGSSSSSIKQIMPKSLKSLYTKYCNTTMKNLVDGIQHTRPRYLKKNHLAPIGTTALLLALTLVSMIALQKNGYGYGQAQPLNDAVEPESRTLMVHGTVRSDPNASGGKSTVYYVATTGDDSNPGTQASPWKTFGKAASSLSAGDTALFMDGTYTVSGDVTRGGSATGFITFQAAAKWGAKLQGNGEAVVLIRSSYVIVKDFEFLGTGSSAANGILAENSNIRTIGNKIHGFSGSGVKTWKSDYNFTNVDFIGNIIYNIGSGELDHGIYVMGQGGIVSNNIVYNVSGFCVHAWHAARNYIFSNNTVWGCGMSGFVIGAGDDPGGVADNFLVTNNISINSKHYGIIETGSTGKNNVYKNNLVFGNGRGGFKVHTHHGTITADPKFVNFQSNGTGDYHLTAGSPAIDKGTAQGAPTTDYDGKARPQGTAPDIGAYEF